MKGKRRKRKDTETNRSYYLHLSEKGRKLRFQFLLFPLTWLPVREEAEETMKDTHTLSEWKKENAEQKEEEEKERNQKNGLIAS